MAIYYVDPINGNNANDGLSYATAVQTITATALNLVTGGDEVRTLESPRVDTGYDATFTNQKVGISTSFSLSNASNTSPIVLTTDLVNGMVTGDWVYVTNVGGNTAANGMWKINVLTNKTFELVGSAGNAAYTSGGAARLRTGSVITLPPGCIKNVSMNGNNTQTVYPNNCGAWTASANVTSSLNTSNFRQGNVAAQLSIATAFTTGKIAYQSLGTTVDFSAYQGLGWNMSFATSVTVPNTTLYLALCSDTLGATIVDRIDITNIFVMTGSVTNAYKIYGYRVGGGNLGSSIQSIALYAQNDPGIVNLVLDNIVAIKDLSNPICITNRHTLANDILTEGYNNIDALWEGPDGAPVATLGYPGTTIASQGSPYYGGTPGVRRLYTMLPFNAGPFGSATIGFNIVFNSVTTPITISGGWSAASSMSVKTGISAISTANGVGTIIQALSKNGFFWDSMAFGYCNYGMNISGNYGTCFKNCHFFGAQNNGISIANTLLARFGLDFYSDVDPYPCTFNTCNNGLIFTTMYGAIVKYCNFLGDAASGMTLTTSSSCLIDQCKFITNSNGSGLRISSGGNRVQNCTFNYCLTGLSTDTNGGNNTIKDCTFNNGTIAGISSSVVLGSLVQNCTFGACGNNVQLTNASVGTKVIGGNLGSNVATGFSLQSQSNASFIGCQNLSAFATTWTPVGIIAQYQNCYAYSGTVPYFGQTELYNSNISTTSDTHAANVGLTTSANQITLGNLNSATGIGGRNSRNKSYQPFGKINCTANKLHTVTGWVKNNGIGNTGYAQLALLGNTIGGINTDVLSTPSGSSEWVQHTISFTPTESGVVQIYISIWDGFSFICDGLNCTIAA